MEFLDQFREGLKIIGLAKNETVQFVVDQSGHAGMRGSDYRQPASHGFQDGETEGIFAGGADIEISGRVEIENVIARWFKTATLAKA